MIEMIALLCVKQASELGAAQLTWLLLQQPLTYCTEQTQFSFQVPHWHRDVVACRAGSSS